MKSKFFTSATALMILVGTVSFAGQRAQGQGQGQGQAQAQRKNHPRINQVNKRKQNQQGRIANGLKNGTLNASQASRVEGQEARIQGQENRDIKQNGGHLTTGEQKQINNELNHTSKEIYADKHGGTSPQGTDPGHPRINEVNGREQNQQNRIANGLQSGKMSAQQASQIEGQEAKIQSQEKADIAQNGGHLTAAEQKQFNGELNHTSREIYDDKHGITPNSGRTPASGSAPVAVPVAPVAPVVPVAPGTTQ